MTQRNNDGYAKIRTSEFGQTTFDAALDNLVNVDSRGHSNSPAYNHMRGQLIDLSERLGELSRREEGKEKILTAEDLSGLKQMYTDAIQACNEYLSGKYSWKWSGLGRGRISCTRELLSIMEKDLAALNSVSEKENRTLGSILFLSRADEISVDAREEDYTTVGAKSSLRIPLEVTTDTGSQRGFFTEDQKIESAGEMILSLQREHQLLWVDDFLQLYLTGENFPNRARLETLTDSVQKIDDYLKQNGLSYADLAENENFFRAAMTAFFDHSLEGMDNKDAKVQQILDQVSGDAASRRAFTSLVLDTRDRYDYIQTARTVDMDRGGDIPARNVAMTRIADLLGVGHVIAKARKTKIIDKDGKERTGVFQETADGSDINHLKKDDMLYALADDPSQIMNDPEILRQISDLTILDYLCGNDDRHEGNVIFDMQIVDGKPKLVGIKGIDNDRSFGKFGPTDTGNYTLLPGLMPIRKSTADRILALTEDDVKIACKDLGVSDEEISFFMERVQSTQSFLNDEMNRELILEDEEFEGQQLMGGVLKNIPRMLADKKKALENNEPELKVISEPKAKPEQKELVYNRARMVSEPQFLKTDIKKINLQGLLAHRASLGTIKAELDNSKSFGHWNGSNYEWMVQSMENVIAEIDLLTSKKSISPEGPLPEKYAKRIDVLYRQMRLASAKYLETHRNPKLPMGQKRKSCAAQLYNMRPLQDFQPRLKVKEIALDNIAGAQPIPRPEVKKSLRRVKNEAKLKDNDRIRNNPTLGGDDSIIHT